MTVIAKLSNIAWDTTDYDEEEDGFGANIPDLPTDLEIEIPENADILKLPTEDEKEERISDWLTKTYQFCHDGFAIEWVTE